MAWPTPTKTRCHICLGAGMSRSFPGQSCTHCRGLGFVVTEGAIAACVVLWMVVVAGVIVLLAWLSWR